MIILQFLQSTWDRHKLWLRVCLNQPNICNVSAYVRMSLIFAWLSKFFNGPHDIFYGGGRWRTDVVRTQLYAGSSPHRACVGKRLLITLHSSSARRSRTNLSTQLHAGSSPSRMFRQNFNYPTTFFVSTQKSCVRIDSSTPAVVHCVVGVGGAVWV